MTLFNNIARQPEDATENLLAKRQLNIKENNSTSWFVTIKKKLYKYDLPNPLSLLEKKNEWKNTVKKAVEKHWKTVILENCITYNSFNYLHCDVFQPNKIPHLIQIDNTSDPSVEAVRIAVKLKLVTGTYNLQVRAAKFRSANTRICEICNEEDEDIEHFLLGCKILQCVRAPFLNELTDTLLGTYSKQLLDLPSVVCLQLILDCTKLYNHENHSWFIYNKDVERAIEHISRKMCYALHSVRIRSLMKRK